MKDLQMNSKDAWRKTRRLKGEGFFPRKIWKDDSNKLDCPNLLSSFMQSNKSNEWFYLPRASLWISLDRLNPSNSYFQGPPNQSLLFHLPKNGRGNAGAKKVGTNKAVWTREEKKQAFLQGQIDQLHTAISSHESLPDTNLE